MRCLLRTNRNYVYMLGDMGPTLRVVSGLSAITKYVSLCAHRMGHDYSH